MALTEINTQGIKNATIKREDLEADIIDQTKLADNAVAHEHIADNAVITAKISDDAVDETKIADDAVTGAKLSVSLVQGDVLYGSGTDALARLAKGTAGQSLVMNSGATAPEWGDSAAGAGGGGSDKIFWENGQTVTTSYTITDGQNAMSAGPIEIAATGNGDGSAVVVTVGDGETWTIV